MDDMDGRRDSREEVIPDASAEVGRTYDNVESPVPGNGFGEHDVPVFSPKCPMAEMEKEEPKGSDVEMGERRQSNFGADASGLTPSRGDVSTGDYVRPEVTIGTFQRDFEDEEEEEDRLFMNPLDPRIDDHQYRLRMFAIFGFLPFFWVGWLVGAIYGCVKKGTKPIHKKLTVLLSQLTFIVGVLITVLTLAIYFTLPVTKQDNLVIQMQPLIPSGLTAGVPLLEKSKKCGALTVDMYRRELKVKFGSLFADVHGNRPSDKTTVFVFKGLDAEWSEHKIFTGEFGAQLPNEPAETYSAKDDIFAVNITAGDPSTIRDEGTAGNIYGLPKLNVLMKCMDVKAKKIHLVATFDDKDAGAFKPDESQDPYETILAVGLFEPTDTTYLGNPAIPSYVGFVNKQIMCNKKNVYFPVEITGAKELSYEARNKGYGELKKYLTDPAKARSLTAKPLNLGFSYTTRELLTKTQTALKALMEYEKVKDTASESKRFKSCL
ncbi:hypothetical protein, conserved [Babesia bigemina]|uniref:Uncharacterized protein n=1 Tax=Babesia bigemina TaxID=5866 RepID=A0A061D2J0_BABBI|nr:hypothetical protein, conserved [Babesia bigemina]CDR94996.1 hypothetical protein, conserved [Babesia bigemina]|eukprot:XP_012767182.1 hypothetical protein, conserved [Babesia bigemina]